MWRTEVRGRRTAGNAGGTICGIGGVEVLKCASSKVFKCGETFGSQTVFLEAAGGFVGKGVFD